MLRGFAKKLYLFYKKTHFRLYKKQKTESQGSPSVRFFCFMLYRGWGAAFYQTSCCGCDTLRFVIPLPHRRCGAAFCHISCCGCDMPRFVISLPRLRHAAFCHISCCGCSAAFCHTPAALRLRRRVLSYLCRGYETLRFAISPAATRCVLSYLCRAAAATRCVLPYLLLRLRHVAFCHIPATLPSIMYLCRSLPPG